MVIAVTLLGVAADDDQYAVTWRPGGPDYGPVPVQQPYQAPVQPHYSAVYSGPQPTKQPVGGSAPADAVQKATEEFSR